MIAAAHQSCPVVVVRALCGALVFAAAGCAEAPAPPVPAEPAAVFVAPSAVELRAGQAVQLVAQANDADGRAIGGARLQFTSDAPALVDVTREGLASATGPVGTATVRVASGAAETAVAITVRHAGVHALTSLEPLPAAFTSPPPPAEMGTAAGRADDRPALAIPLAVRAADAFGNPVPGTVLTFTVTAGEGTVEPPTVTTDAGGGARATWRLGAADGEHAVEATTPGVAPLVLRTTRGTAATAASAEPADEHLDQP